MDIIASIISGVISPITNVLGLWLTKHEDVSLEKFKVDGQVDIALVQANLQVFQAQMDLAKSKAMQVLIAAFGLPTAFYYGKCLTWDAALHLGTTDALKGDVATMSMLIVGFIFAHSAIDKWTRKT
jgi:hypothetical protein